MAPPQPNNSTNVDEPRTGAFIGPWRVERLLGRGAAARVYNVRHAAGGGRAALKLLSPAHAASPYLELGAIDARDPTHVFYVGGKRSQSLSESVR